MVNSLPKVSILVAARNEEECILNCLQALNQVDYPKELIEILIGNDDSTDQTAWLVEKYIQDKPWFRLFTITHPLNGLQGKANVLEQLSQHANGEFYFYCDADIEVPPTWIKGFLPSFQDQQIGVVNGVTLMRPEGLFADLQSIEWIFALSTFRVLSFWKIPVTSMGNNMAVRRSAYEQVGGYTQIGFSIVEDYALFKALLQHNNGFEQTFTTKVLARSVPNRTLASQFRQRKRWMQGAMQLPFPFIVLFIVLCFLPLVFLATYFVAPVLATKMLLAYFLPLLLGATVGIVILQQYRLFPALLVFPLYVTMMNLMSLYSYYSKGNVQWKQRYYQQDK